MSQTPSSRQAFRFFPIFSQALTLFPNSPIIYHIDGTVYPRKGGKDLKITRAELTHFRSYEGCEIVPCEGVNVLLGDNGQGKTNVLEALYLCCTGRSHRTRQDRELIRWGADFAAVRVEALRRDGTHRVEIALPALGRRKIKVSGQEISRSGELMGHVTGVLFSPEDLRTVKDGPAERRRFVDMALSQVKPAYYYALQRYARALKQRNEALKAIAARPELMATLDAWDEQLAAAGVGLMAQRRDYIRRLSQTAAAIHRDIADDKERLEIRYLPSVSAGDDDTAFLDGPGRAGLRLSGPAAHGGAVDAAGRAGRDARAAGGVAHADAGRRDERAGPRPPPPAGQQAQRRADLHHLHRRRRPRRGRGRQGLAGGKWGVERGLTGGSVLF